jgi:crotonobetainyl-CoA:carnitine CoA-transferase CaiB-like acyl-CoA transferase
LLSNVLALDFATGRAGFCSKLLADLGAQVIKIETPEGDSGRARGPFFKSQSLSFFYNNSGKLGIVVDPKTPAGEKNLKDLLSFADILVETGMPDALPSINPRITRLSIPSGASYPASLHGAIAVVLSLLRRKITGEGCHIKLSRKIPAADANDRGFFHILPCRDGFIQMTILRNWETLLELMDSEGLAGDLKEAKWQEEFHRIENIEHILDIVSRWTRRHPKRDLFYLGQSMRFPWAPVEHAVDVLESPQLAARNFLIAPELPGKGSILLMPGQPFRFDSNCPIHRKPAPALGEDQPILNHLGSLKKGEIDPDGFIASNIRHEEILAGLRIIDLTRMLSGPYATMMLADFGAEVIKIQSPATANGAEQNGTDFFKTWNRNKRSLCLDLNQPEARKCFLDLVSISDIVVENYSPRVMANWGLDYSRLRQINPKLIMAGISAMGQTGPWQNYIGFAPTFHALSGFLDALAPSSDALENSAYPYADIVTALYSVLAILGSVANRNVTGKGCFIDISAYECLCAVMGPSFIARAAGLNESNEELQAIREDSNPDQLVFWPWQTDPERWSPAPSLGQDNQYVAELLGRTPLNID